ncbi:MAG: hypothetical protein K0A98_09115 [Trueperaceae bacterium]|nr:hypothetical protein [Trueperaceae bacterium]
MADLIVELYGTRIGVLTGDARAFDLKIEPGAVKAFGIDSPILSIAIPLALVPTRTHLIEEGRSWGLRDAERTIHEALETVLETAGNEVPHARAYPRLVENITRFTRNLLAGRPAGPPAT